MWKWYVTGPIARWFWCLGTDAKASIALGVVWFSCLTPAVPVLLGFALGTTFAIDVAINVWKTLWPMAVNAKVRSVWRTRAMVSTGVLATAFLLECVVLPGSSVPFALLLATTLALVASATVWAKAHAAEVREAEHHLRVMRHYDQQRREREREAAKPKPPPPPTLKQRAETLAAELAEMEEAIDALGLPPAESRAAKARARRLKKRELDGLFGKHSDS